MQKNFIKEAVSIIIGKQFENIADIINTKKHVNEFLIAKKLNITINQARNLLYKLANHGLVSSIRKKNKKKGWYTYFWKLEKLKSLEFLKEISRKKAEQFNNQIKNRETRDFYICEKCDIEFNEENALTNDFTCRECGGVFSVKDKTKDMKEFRKELDKINRDLNLIGEEIHEEKEREGKDISRQIKKEKKEEEKRKQTIKLLRKKQLKKILFKKHSKKTKKRVKKKIFKKIKKRKDSKKKKR